MAKLPTQWGAVDVPDDATDDQIDAAVEQLRQSQQPQSFLGALGHTLKAGTIDPIANMVMQGYYAQKEGGQPGLASYAAQLPANLAAGAWKQSLPHTQAAIDAMKQGHVGDALTQGVFSLPVIGPQLADTFGAMAKYSKAPAERRAETGGEAVGQTALTALNLLPEEALEKITGPVRAAAPGLYRSVAHFPMSMSLQDMKGAAQVAIDNNIPLGDLFGVYGGHEQALEKLGNGKTGLIGSNMNQVHKLVQANGAKQLDMNTVLKPVTDAIDQWEAAPSGAETAQQLKDLLGKFLKDKSLGIYDTKGNLVGWKPVSMRQAQDLKEAAYGILPSGIYSDTKDAFGATQKEFNRLIASGIRKGQNDILPELKTYNDTVHNAINLRDRVEELAKQGVQLSMKDLIPLGVGLGVGAGAAGVGHPLMFSPEALAATGAAYALNRPTPASRVALFMGNAGKGPGGEILGQTTRLATLAKQRYADRVNQNDFGYKPKLDTSQITTKQPVRLEQIPMMADAEARRQQVDPLLVRAVVAAESGGHPSATSPKGAQGVMQLMPETAKEMGVKDPTDAADNIRGGVGYLKKLLTKYKGNLPTTLAAYNWGEGHVDKGEQPPPETLDYIESVLSKMKQ